ncbi:nuclease, partial [Thalictrum thalictroides]
DAVGTVDGTHIEANISLNDQPSYRNRKGFISQNVLVACTFDMKFTYVMVGFEGSAHDGRLLRSVVAPRERRLTVPTGNI